MADVPRKKTLEEVKKEAIAELERRTDKLAYR